MGGSLCTIIRGSFAHQSRAAASLARRAAIAARSSAPGGSSPSASLRIRLPIPIPCSTAENHRCEYVARRERVVKKSSTSRQRVGEKSPQKVVNKSPKIRQKVLKSHFFGHQRSPKASFGDLKSPKVMNKHGLETPQQARSPQEDSNGSILRSKLE